MTLKDISNGLLGNTPSNNNSNTPSNNNNNKHSNNNNNTPSNNNSNEGFQNINILGFNFNRTCMMLLIIFTLIVMYKEDIMKLKFMKQVFK